MVHEAVLPRGRGHRDASLEEPLDVVGQRTLEAAQEAEGGVLAKEDAGVLDEAHHGVPVDGHGDGSRGPVEVGELIGHGRVGRGEVVVVVAGGVVLVGVLATHHREGVSTGNTG